jgi:hypothetical protein
MTARARYLMRSDETAKRSGAEERYRGGGAVCRETE